MLPRHPFFRLLVINMLLGVMLAVIVVGAVIALDVGHVGTLLMKDRNPLAALVILLGSFIVTCASVMMGTAIMMLARNDGGPASGKRERLVPAPVMVRVRSARK